MSSPLSTLKKTRRGPLLPGQGPHSQQGGRGRVPFKRTIYTEYEAALQDDASLFTCTDAASTSKTKASLNNSCAPPSDFELMSSMMQRVTQLEAMVRIQASELEHKETKISVLEEKLKHLKEPRDKTSDQNEEDDAVKMCQQLQTQVYEMECFLSDYGLVWVGDRESRDPACRQEGGEAEHVQTQSPDAAPLWSPDTPKTFRMNFNLVLRSIRELNILGGEGECFVQATARGAQLATKAPIQLGLYSNGIVMFDGPFRSYQEPSTQRCMQDLMDGYFPSELQERFPDGVPFEVRDRREEEFITQRPWDGEGRVLSGSSNTPPSQIPGKKLTMDQFLNKLPKVLVKAGRVIDIRDSVKATLQGSSDAPRGCSATLVDTPAVQAMKERLEICDRPRSARDVTTLRVKSEDGEQSYILKMRFSETIGHLRQHLDKHRGEGVPGYDIISVFPQRCYGDDSQSLLSCGLTPNAALLLRTKQ